MPATHTQTDGYRQKLGRGNNRKKWKWVDDNNFRNCSMDIPVFQQAEGNPAKRGIDGPFSPACY
jgi:hypothetical protein